MLEAKLILLEFEIVPKMLLNCSRFLIPKIIPCKSLLPNALQKQTSNDELKTLENAEFLID